MLSRPDRIGDVVITSACFAPVRAALPGTAIHFLAQGRMEPLFRAHPGLKSFQTVPPDLDPARRRERLATQLAGLKADCIVHLHADPDVGWAAAQAGIPRRIGFDEKGALGLTESLPNRKKRGEKHEGFYNFDLLARLGVPVPAKLVPQLMPEREALARLSAKLPAGIVPGSYAVLHVGAHVGKPRISPEFFIATARWLARERRLKVLVIGTEPDGKEVAAILAEAGGTAAGMHNFCGQTDLAEAAFLLRDAAVVFGRDSGPAHLAAAMGACTVTLMMDSELTNSGRRWKPLGDNSWALDKPLQRGWFESKIAFGHRNLRQYTPEEIIGAIKIALDAPGPANRTF